MANNKMEMDSCIHEQDNNNINERLPNDLLLLIFSYMSTKELSLYVLPICHKWYEVGNHPTLWTAIDLTMYDNEKDEDYTKLLSKATVLRSLECWRATNAFLTNVVCTCPGRLTLRRLELPYTVCITVKTMRALTRACPNITFLDMSRGKQGHSERRALHLITQWKQLRTLKLDHCSWITSGFVNRLGASCPELVHIGMDCNLLPCDVICNLLERLQSNLTHISIKCEAFTDELRKSIHKCLQLEQLHVKVLIGPVSLEQNHVCSHLKRLSKLSIYCCTERFTGEHETLRVFKSTTFTGLSELSMYLQSGDDALAIDVATSLPNLQTVKLEMWSRLTDRGLAQLLCLCQDLSSVTLVGCDRIRGHGFLLSWYCTEHRPYEPHSPTCGGYNLTCSTTDVVPAPPASCASGNDSVCPHRVSVKTPLELVLLQECSGVLPSVIAATVMRECVKVLVVNSRRWEAELDDDNWPMDRGYV